MNRDTFLAATDRSGWETVQAIGEVRHQLEELGRRTMISFVDTGFVREQVARLAGLDPGDLKLDVARLHREMKEIKGFRLLRTYIYDGRLDPGDPEYSEQELDLERMAEVPGVQLRLGHARGTRGRRRQKGVDTLLVLDMMIMAQQGAYDLAMLWTGDSDFREVVDQVQRMGKQVALVTTNDDRAAKDLRQTCDIVVEMPAQFWASLEHRSVGGPSSTP